jgi:hypothetical protein
MTCVALLPGMQANLACSPCNEALLGNEGLRVRPRSVHPEVAATWEGDMPDPAADPRRHHDLEDTRLYRRFHVCASCRKEYAGCPGCRTTQLHD